MAGGGGQMHGSVTQVSTPTLGKRNLLPLLQHDQSLRQAIPIRAILQGPAPGGPALGQSQFNLLLKNSLVSSQLSVYELTF